MRIETNLHILVYCFIVYSFFWAVIRTNPTKKWIRKVLIIIGSLIMPAIIPGHGELILAFPNVALLSIPTAVTWGICLLFIVINHMIIMYTLQIYRQYKQK